MPEHRGTKAETIVRAQEFARIIANGGRRSDCIRFAQENWGVGEDASYKYLKLARDQLKADWEIERQQMIADLLSQCATHHQEARATGQYHIALRPVSYQHYHLPPMRHL